MFPNNTSRDTAFENVSSRILVSKGIDSGTQRIMERSQIPGTMLYVNCNWKIKKFPGRAEKSGLEATYPGRSPQITQHPSARLGSLQLPPATPTAALENMCCCLNFFMSLVSIPKFGMEVSDWQSLGHMPAALLQGWLEMRIHSSLHFHRRQWDVPSEKRQMQGWVAQIKQTSL